MSFLPVSVVLPFKNTEKYIFSALNSLKNQTFCDFEVVLVDDGSIDASRQIARDFCLQDSRFKLIDGGNGLVDSLNSGLAEAQGEWIARFDSDDICHPKRLELQLELAKLHGPETVVSCRVRSFPDNLVSEGYRTYENWINNLVTPLEIEHSLFIESPIPHPTAFYNRKSVLHVGGYRSLGLPEDYELWLRLWQDGFNFVRVPSNLLAWRERADRFSRLSSVYSLTSFYKTKAMYLGFVPALRSKKIIIAGTGQTARRLSKFLMNQGFYIKCFLSPEEEPRKKELRNRPVESISCFREFGDLPILVASRRPGAREAIRVFLEAQGLTNWDDFVLCS